VGVFGSWGAASELMFSLSECTQRGRASGRSSRPGETKRAWIGSLAVLLEVRPRPGRKHLATAQRLRLTEFGPNLDPNELPQTNSFAHVENHSSFSGVFWSERRDLNSRPPVPQTGALTGLRYAPNDDATIVIGHFSRNMRSPSTTSQRKVAIESGSLFRSSDQS
jgi:hypothetical protein